MTAPIFLIGGGKGGVGKSMLSMALLDYLRETERPPLLIETDTSAPDVWKAYKADVDNQCIDLEQRDGWLELLDVIDRNAAVATVINTKAANQVGLRKFGGMLTEKARTAAEAEFRAAGARVRSELAQSVANAAREIADRAASARRSQWIAACLAIAASAFIVVGGWAFGTGRRSGFDAGRAEGYSAAREEKAAAAWANTPDGQLAYALAKAGSIRELALCSGRGWKREGGYCVPRPEKSGIFGWRLANRLDDGR